MTRKIIHIDMDCFYAAVEMRDNPSLQNKPIAIGGLSEHRGVLSTCNYLARNDGLHSAMATAKAFRLCPDLVLLPVNMSKYKSVSKQMRDIFSQYTSIIEPLSLDEAYLDVSNCDLHHGSATLIARAIKDQISKELNLTASAGVAPNKFLAKVASDWEKPNGLFVITPDQVDEFVKKLSIKKIYGVGKVTAQKMEKIGIKTCWDLQQIELAKLVKHFGNFGGKLYKLCRGIDDRQVEPQRIRKSLSVEETYSVDLKDFAVCDKALGPLIERFHERLSKVSNLQIAKQFIKIKFYDFTHTTVEQVVAQLDCVLYKKLLREGFDRHNKPVRLLGVGVRFKQNEPKRGQASLI